MYSKHRKALSIFVISFFLIIIFIKFLSQNFNFKRTTIPQNVQKAQNISFELDDISWILDSYKKSNFLLIYSDNHANLVFEPLDHLSTPYILQSDTIFPGSLPCPTPTFTSLSKDAMIGLYNNKATNLTFNFQNTHFYLFSYKNNFYYMNNIDDKVFNSLYDDFPVSNIIITYIDKDSFNSSGEGNGQGLLFTGGSIVDLEWNKSEDNPIKLVKEDTDPISVTDGRTCWIIADETCKIDFK